MTSDRAHKVYEAFYLELDREFTSDMKNALVSAIRSCASLTWDDEDLRPSYEILEEIANELDELK